MATAANAAAVANAEENEAAEAAARQLEAENLYYWRTGKNLAMERQPAGTTL